ncbi:hypothetical protein K0A97_01425 [Patescibacteria group bacterium]|nr:hypothetical protein [Patescibacteria group bacterium]
MNKYNSNTQEKKKVLYFPSGTNPPKKSGLNTFLIILAVVFFIGIIFLVLFILGFFQTTIPELEIMSGKNINLREGKSVRFILEDVTHTLRVISTNNNSASLTLESDPIDFILEEGQEKKFNLNGAGTYNLKIKLIRIEEGTLEVYIKKINEAICTENWSCTIWSNCSQGGTQTRNCTDLNQCGTILSKPPITQECDPLSCAENWSCTAWSTCSGNETQTRNCTDLNQCGTTLNKPSEVRICTLDILDCGTSFLIFMETSGDSQNLNLSPQHCFAEALENCEPAKLTQFTVFEILGIVTTSISNLEIIGINESDDTCIYYSKLTNQTIYFSNWLMEALLSLGNTALEIEEQIEVANNYSMLLWGMETFCYFDLDDLPEISDAFYDADWSGEANCIFINEELECTYGGNASYYNSCEYFLED